MKTCIGVYVNMQYQQVFKMVVYQTMTARIDLTGMVVVIVLDQYLHEDDPGLPRPVTVSLAISCTYAYA